MLGIIVVLALTGVGLFVYQQGSSDPQISPTATPPEGVPTGISNVRPECQLSGRIVFIADKLTRSDGASFVYQWVMDSHDTLNWSINPAEDVRVGPNRFSAIPLPNGKETPTIAFNQGKPSLTTYKLSASIDYPYVVNNKVEVLNQKCTGTIEVKIAY